MRAELGTFLHILKHTRMPLTRIHKYTQMCIRHVFLLIFQLVLQDCFFFRVLIRIVVKFNGVMNFILIPFQLAFLNIYDLKNNLCFK